MSYTVHTYNGNVGTEETFATFEEAFKAADDEWYHLTPIERMRTTDESIGAWFYISEDDENGEEITVVYDFAVLLDEEDE